MELQDWASVISAGVAVASAFFAHVEQKKAAKSAKIAAEAQVELAATNKEMARLQAIANSREVNQLIVEMDPRRAKLTVFNPFHFTISKLQVEGSEVANHKIWLENIAPQSTSEILLAVDRDGRVPYTRFGRVYFNWETPEGKKRSQSFEFPKRESQ